VLQNEFSRLGTTREKSSSAVPEEAAEFVIDSERRMVVVRFRNRVTGADIADYVKRMACHPRFEPSFSEIVDLTGVKDLDLNADDFLRLADQIDPFLADAKRAFVVRTSVQNHAARMHRILRVHRNIEIFRSFEEAEEWLGL